MKRTQIQLEESVWERLREKAFQEHRSFSDVVRELAAKEIHSRKQSCKRQTKEFSFVGSGASRGRRGSGKVSKKHDEELAGAYLR